MDLDSERRAFDPPIVLLRSAAFETRHTIRHESLGCLSALGLAILEEVQEVLVHPLDSPQEFINPNGFAG